jgi:hypothetical protein
VQRRSLPAKHDSRQLKDRESDPELSEKQSDGALTLNGFRVSLRQFEQQGIVASFIQDLFPLGRSTVQLSFIGSWLWHVPEALRKSRALDLAAESLALAYFAKEAGSTETLIRSHLLYTDALRSLSESLQDHRSRLASETLCATLLLVHYEV